MGRKVNLARRRAGPKHQMRRSIISRDLRVSALVDKRAELAVQKDAKSNKIILVLKRFRQRSRQTHRNEQFR
jgi:hypothetical protein